MCAFFGAEPSTALGCTRTAHVCAWNSLVRRLMSLPVDWLQVDCLCACVGRWRAARVVKAWEGIALGRKAAHVRARLLRLVFRKVFSLWLHRVDALAMAKKRAAEAAVRQRAAAAYFFLQRWKMRRSQVRIPTRRLAGVCEYFAKSSRSIFHQCTCAHCTCWLCLHAPQRKILDRLIARQGRVLMEYTVGEWHQCTQNCKASTDQMIGLSRFVGVESVFFKTGSRGIFGVKPRPSLAVCVCGSSRVWQLCMCRE